MIPLTQTPDAAPKATPALSAEVMAFLDDLRQVAMACRAKPRAHLFEACALLKTDKKATAEAHAEALMRCLGEAFGTPARLYAPGTPELTFDERWLIRLAQAFAEGDEDSKRFLLHSRVGHENRRLIGFLLGRIATAPPSD